MLKLGIRKKVLDDEDFIFQELEGESADTFLEERFPTEGIGFPGIVLLKGDSEQLRGFIQGDARFHFLNGMNDSCFKTGKDISGCFKGFKDFLIGMDGLETAIINGLSCFILEEYFCNPDSF